MSKAFFVAAYRLIAALLAVSTTLHSVADYWHLPGFHLGNYLSYFTQLSSLYAAAMLAVGLWRIARPGSARYESMRGAAVLYVLITAIVYELLLARLDALHHVTPAFNNWVLHRIVPLVMLCDWLYVEPRLPIPRRSAFVWLGFPIVYLSYTLVRGSFENWYPYPFVDPRPHGYLPVAIQCSLIALGAVALAIGIRWLGNHARQSGAVTLRKQ
ncbi:Pr6Pr family membrane protein [Burkholderia contaminans]|uniref:Pr6Pr family membrane protein n=1 Tax=Burkholderia contaminans TaxID=488447 RepID=UPI001CF13DBA|nr:Pr6Pr family membrane protein [Burkholderia contaminans]MCA8096160.1 Pr6Pr family membrane protein [Burkholderia contaminans]